MHKEHLFEQRIAIQEVPILVAIRIVLQEEQRKPNPVKAQTTSCNKRNFSYWLSNVI